VPEPLRSPFHPFLVIVFGTLTVLLVGLLTTRFLPEDQRIGRKFEVVSK
jgi:hypothetical protein